MVPETEIVTIPPTAATEAYMGDATIRTKAKAYDFLGSFTRETEENPFSSMEIGQLIGVYLTNQSKIGIRQFADRCHMKRQRLEKIIDGAVATEHEAAAIQTLFADISKRMDQQKTKIKPPPRPIT